MNSTLIDVIKNAGRLHRGIRFLELDGNMSEITYDKLYDIAKRQLNMLHAAGIRRGDEVILQIPDICSFVCAFWACILGGIIAVPVPVASSESEYYRVYRIWHKLHNPHILTTTLYYNRLIDYVKGLNEIELVDKISKGFVDCTKLSENAEPCEPAEIIPSDIAYLQFSSGSTTEPKGVRLTHDQIIANLEGISNKANINENDSGISWLPLSHDMGIVGFHFVPAFLGVEQCLINPSCFISDPIGYLQIISKYRYTITGIPNFGYSLLLQALAHTPERVQNLDLSSLRLVFNGAEPISVEIINRFCKTMQPFGLQENVMYPVYGLAEAVLAVAFPNPGDKYHYLTVDSDSIGWGDEIRIVDEYNTRAIRVISEGQAVKHCSIRICNRTDKSLSDNYVGQILIKGRNVTKGYYDRCAGDYDVLNKDGWYKTGDLGFIHDGELYVVGRIKDIIFSNGRNFYAYEIEKCVENSYPELIGKLVACGISDKKKKNDQLVLFFLSDGQLEQDIKTATAISNCVYNFFGLRPECLVPTTERFTTMSGKLQRFQYIQRYQKGVYANACIKQNQLLVNTDEMGEEVLPQNETEALLFDFCKQTLCLDHISVNDNFAQLGVDSLKVVELFNMIQKRWGDKVAVSDLYSHPSIHSLANYIDSANSKNQPSFHLREVVPKQFTTCFTLTSAIKTSVYDGIKEMCKSLSISFCSVLYASVSAVLAQHCDTDSFTLYVQEADGKLGKLNFSRDIFNNTKGLLKYISTSVISVRSTEALKTHSPKDSIQVLCSMDKASKTIEFNGMFDMAFELLQFDDSYIFKLSCADYIGESLAQTLLRECIIVFTNIYKKINEL